MIPAAYLAVACVRYYRTMDELQQRIALEALAFAFGGTALITFGYGFLDAAGPAHQLVVGVAGHGEPLDHRRLAGEEALAVKNSLRELRAERGWTQADLSRELEVSRQTVNSIETGKYDPSLPLAFRIAALFERPIEAIFEPEAA